MGLETWGAEEFIRRVNDERTRLAALWPRVRDHADLIPTEQKIAWNAMVYVQQGMELQIMAGLRARGGEVREQRAETVGVFAGLPGGGVAHDPTDGRFAVPRLDVAERDIIDIVGAGAAVGALPVAIAVGLWVVFFLLAVLVTLSVTGVLELVEKHWTATAKYEAWLDAYLAKRGDVPPPPPAPSSGIGVGLLVAGAVLGVGYLAYKVVGGQRARSAA